MLSRYCAPTFEETVVKVKKITLIILILTFYGFMYSQGMWMQKANFGGTARAEAISFSIGTKGYIGTGGSPSVGWTKDFWEWNQATNVWTQKANFGGTARSGAVGFSIGTKGYIGTGAYWNGDLQDFWEWDQVMNVWTQKANFPGISRSGASSFSIGNKAYVGCGYDNNYYLKDFWEWDQATNTWTRKADFAGTWRTGSVSFSIGTKGYIGTGFCYGCNPYYGTFQDFWEYDPASDTWSQKSNFPGIARYGASAFSIGIKGYIGLGSWCMEDCPLQDFWQWDQATDTWTQITSFTGSSRMGAVGFSIGNRGYIGTGEQPNSFGGSNVLDEFWEFNPDSTSTGIENIKNIIEINIFPNPSYGIFKVALHNCPEAKLSVYDDMGNRLLERNCRGETSQEINLSCQPKGIYFVELLSGEERVVKKVAVQ